MLKFISDLKCTEPLSEDAVYMIMNDLVEHITPYHDISKKTRYSIAYLGRVASGWLISAGRESTKYLLKCD